MGIKELKERIQQQSLAINRVPTQTKEGFIALANAEFCGDYGLTLREILNQALEYRAMKYTFFDNIDMKLDKILEGVPQIEEKPEKETINLLSGKRIEVKGGDN